MSIKLKSKSRKKQRNTGLAALIIIVVLLLAGMGIAIHNLSEKAAAYAMREAELESLIALEEERANEFTELARFRQTLKYIEMIAREKLGLVYPEEIILKPEQ